MKNLIIFFAFCSLSFANVVAHNGSSVILEFKKGSVSKLSIGKKKLHVLPHPKDTKKSIVFIPIKYRQSTDLVLDYKFKGKSKKLFIDVKQKKYKREKLRVDGSRVKPPKKVLKRISQEYKEAMRIYGSFDKKRYWSKPFINPLNSKITSHYGTARVFNGKLKSFHGGTDFRAKMKTPIRASNDGVVVLSKKRYYAGGTIILSHGEGVYTCYYHLSKMTLKVGDRVKRGDIVGLSGKSGRVTGPHLHFTVMLNGVSVDSQDFIDKVNALFENE